ncbi:NAD-P-binding protein [Obba rivulosa]|uniref:NAD-P-binding protein n=1 Tax=Obba rivulosa TaxID=1052685 RepID=A0A8E2DS87_9APHY|nr:NAD-P-binding protein [Obba rivulosa]
MATLIEVLAAVGVLLLIPKVYGLLSFIWLYVRPSSVHNYLHGPKPAWAIVTGASDGIGKAIAQELYDKGFNLILHGRSEQKVRAVVEGLRARSTATGARDVRYFLADAGAPGHDFAKLVAPYSDLNITLVVHNVGGSSDVRNERLDKRSEAEMLCDFHLNAAFPLFLTRVLLPQLRTSAKHGPVLVQFVGSLASEIGPPRLPLYAASKAFLKGLTRALDNDERAWSPTGVHFTYMYVGEVVTNSMKTDVSLGSPSAETFAKAYVARIGCGWRRYHPYVIHAIQDWFMQGLGENVVDRFVMKRMGELVVQLEKRS